MRIGVLADASGERYYLDEETAARARRGRLRRVQLILAVLVVALFVIYVTANL